MLASLFNNFFGFELSNGAQFAIGSGLILIGGMVITSLVFYIFRKY